MSKVYIEKDMLEKAASSGRRGGSTRIIESNTVVTEESAPDAVAESSETITEEAAEEAIEGTTASEDTASEDTVALDDMATEEEAADNEGATEVVTEDMVEVPEGIVIDDGMYIDPGFDEGMYMDPSMETGMVEVKDPLLSSWPFVIGISAAVLFISVALGALLARRKIKKGIDLYED